MQIYGLLVLASPPGAGAIPLTTAWELGSFSWLQRGTVQDMMGFMARVSTINDVASYLYNSDSQVANADIRVLA